MQDLMFTSILNMPQDDMNDEDTDSTYSLHTYVEIVKGSREV